MVESMWGRYGSLRGRELWGNYCKGNQVSRTSESTHSNTGFLPCPCTKHVWCRTTRDDVTADDGLEFVGSTTSGSDTTEVSE